MSNVVRVARARQNSKLLVHVKISFLSPPLGSACLLSYNVLTFLQDLSKTMTVAEEGILDWEVKLPALLIRGGDLNHQVDKWNNEQDELSSIVITKRQYSNPINLPYPPPPPPPVVTSTK